MSWTSGGNSSSLETFDVEVFWQEYCGPEPWGWDSWSEGCLCGRLAKKRGDDASEFRSSPRSLLWRDLVPDLRLPAFCYRAGFVLKYVVAAQVCKFHGSWRRAACTDWFKCWYSLLKGKRWRKPATLTFEKWEGILSTRRATSWLFS